MAAERIARLTTLNGFVFPARTRRNFGFGPRVYQSQRHKRPRSRRAAVPDNWIKENRMKMTKWILPIACVAALGACSSMDRDMHSSSGMSSSGTTHSANKQETTSGAFSSPGTANMPGSKGTAGAPVDPNAPGSSMNGGAGMGGTGMGSGSGSMSR
jgi:hypothetical protein